MSISTDMRNLFIYLFVSDMYMTEFQKRELSHAHILIF